jgi:hypothetical protein
MENVLREDDGGVQILAPGTWFEMGKNGLSDVGSVNALFAENTCTVYAHGVV